MPRAPQGLLLAVTLSFAPSAWAQSTTYGRITGVVRDPTGLALPGVSVTLRGTALLGQRTVTSQRDGSYLFRALDPGTFELELELAGFETRRRRDVVVRTGTTLSFEDTLPLAGVEERVEVSGRSATADVKTTRAGVDFDETELVDVPSATDIWAVLAQSPGIRMHGFDVGGSHKNQQTSYDSMGVLINHRIVSDGVDSSEGINGAGLYYDYYSIEEFQVSSSGTDVEMSGPGASIVMTVKSGGNELSGLYHADYEGESFVGGNVDEALAERGFTGNPNVLLWETHADLGGPIVTDRAWFYGAYNHFEIDKVISGIDPDVATDRGIFDNYLVKLTFQPGEADKLIGYSQWSRKQSPTRGLSPLTPEASTLDQDGWSFVHKAEWQHLWSDRWFTNVQVKHFGQNADLETRVDPLVSPPRLDMATGRASGAHSSPFHVVRWKPQMSAQASYYLPSTTGGHDFKLGFDWFVDSSRAEVPENPVQYLDNSLLGRPHDVDEIVFYNAPRATDNRNAHFDVYLQDIWTASRRLTLTLGARIASQRVYYEPSELLPALTELFPAGKIPGRTLASWHNVAPRLGAAIDLTGGGTTVLKAYFGRFFVNVGDSFDAANPAGGQYLWYEFLDPNENGLYDDVDELGPLVFRSPGATGVAPGLAPPFGDEVSLSLEHEVAPETSLRASYVRKSLKDNYGTWNRAQVNALRRTPVPCGDVAFPCPLDPFTAEPLNLARVPDELANVQDVAIDTFPDGGFAYDTVQIAAGRRFDGRFFLQGSFDFQWRDQLVNAAIDLQNPLFANPLIPDGYTTYWQNHSLDVDHRQPTRNWQARLLGRYVLPAGTAVSLNVRHQSGWSWAPIHRVQIPGSGTEPVFLDDIRANRSDNVTIADVRVEKSFTPRTGHRLTAILDVYNLMNSNAELNFVLRTGSNFRTVIGVLDPRTFKIGVRWQF